MIHNVEQVASVKSGQLSAAYYAQHKAHQDFSNAALLARALAQCSSSGTSYSTIMHDILLAVTTHLK
jgi:predicted amidophosphoribosyltransferase